MIASFLPLSPWVVCVLVTSCPATPWYYKISIGLESVGGNNDAHLNSMQKRNKQYKIDIQKVDSLRVLESIKLRQTIWSRVYFEGNTIISCSLAKKKSASTST